MKPHHLAWLSVHPERSPDWLTATLKAGFDIHHIDGDHQNDDPLNLVLIDHADHMRLHAAPAIRYLVGPRAARSEADRDECATAYTLRTDGLGWADVGIRLYGKTTAQAKAMSRAKRHAEDNGLPWPVAA